MNLTRSTPLSDLPGVGEAKSKALIRLGLARVGDLLGHFPQRYEDRRRCYPIRDAPQDAPCCVRAMVAQPPQLNHVRAGMDLVKVRAIDDTGVLYITFFNQSYTRSVLRCGETYVFFGKIEELSRAARSVSNPVFEKEGAGRYTGLIMPVYHLTAGISNNLLSGLTKRAVNEALDGLPEVLPAEIRKTHSLCPIEYAYRNIHYPSSFEDLERARRRLVFEELFILGCGLSLLKSRRTGDRGRVWRVKAKDFLSLLPFSPTRAQKRAMADLQADFTRGSQMNRLIQGDVGSGKTAVAAFGAWAAAKNGCQCALMAPTELLAEQHYRTMTNLLSPAGVRVGLLTGSTRAAEKRKLLASLAAGEIDLLVGTHALFSEGVEYANLGLVISDEQHRFGVAQRAALAGKGGGAAPHVLVMSATPIPRTLALIIYGDLDVSAIDELPPGRTPVRTFVVGESKRQRMYGFVRKQVSLGRQVYIVCPAVEEGEMAADLEDPAAPPLDLKAATAHAKQLQEEVFPDLRVGLVHGRMKAKSKDAVMAAFGAGELDVLVSTTVVEVGVDVPNASLIIIENAERFGLSQLHQLRGRVGRGQHESFCVLVTASRSEVSRQRLKVLCSTNDGFQIAEEDLRLRGPGDFFGRRQHGLPQLKAADFASDAALLQEARDAAETFIAADPGLKNPEHAALRRRVARMFQDNPGIFN